MANQFTSGRREHHLQATREKIQAANLIHRLQECVFGKVELSSQQVAAAKALLAKVLPDLQATQLTSEVQHNYALMPDKPLTAEEWQQQSAPPKQ